jgi:hypothetical protein
MSKGQLEAYVSVALTPTFKFIIEGIHNLIHCIYLFSWIETQQVLLLVMS